MTHELCNFHGCVALWKNFPYFWWNPTVFSQAQWFLDKVGFPSSLVECIGSIHCTKPGFIFHVSRMRLQRSQLPSVAEPASWGANSDGGLHAPVWCEQSSLLRSLGFATLDFSDFPGLEPQRWGHHRSWEALGPPQKESGTEFSPVFPRWSLLWGGRDAWKRLGSAMDPTLQVQRGRALKACFAR